MPRASPASCSPSYPTRHPELVSGPIPPATRSAERAWGRGFRFTDGTEQAARWALKQVQGDEKGGSSRSWFACFADAVVASRFPTSRRSAWVAAWLSQPPVPTTFLRGKAALCRRAISFQRNHQLHQLRVTLAGSAPLKLNE